MQDILPCIAKEIPGFPAVRPAVTSAALIYLVYSHIAVIIIIAFSL